MQTQQTLIKPSSIQDEASLFTLQNTEIAAHEGTIRHFLDYIENPDWTADEVIDELKEAKAQCWGIGCPTHILGIWITKIFTTKKCKYGLVWIIAGSGLETGRPFYERYCETWFKEQGCEYIELQGRKGWMKVLPDYEFDKVILRKRLL